MHDEEFIVNTPKGDYAVSITHDFEEDNVKAWTEVISPAGERTHLDITPYSPDNNLIKRMIRFHSMFGYWGYGVHKMKSHEFFGPIGAAGQACDRNR